MYNYSALDAKIRYKSLGIKEGDSLFVTSGFGFLGHLDGSLSQDDVCKCHLDILQELIGPKGTLIVPTYSYTFGSSIPSKKAIFDPLVTPSTIGPLPQYVLGQPGFYRTADPMMSISIYGADTSISYNLPFSSYGRDCIFERLLNTSIKCLSIGLGPNWTPFIHYLDFIAHVDYRYDKVFHGILQLPDSTKEINWLYSVPIKSRLFSGNCQKLGFLSAKNGIWRQDILGKGSLSLCNYRDYYDFALDLFTNHSRLTVLASDRLSIFEVEQSHLASSLTTPQCLDDSIPYLDWNSVYSPVTNTSLNSLRDSLSLSLTNCYMDHFEIFSGSSIDGYIVPESWSPQSFSLFSIDGSHIVTFANCDDLKKVFLPHSSTDQGLLNSLSFHDPYSCDMTTKIIESTYTKFISISTPFFSFIKARYPHSYTYKLDVANFYSSLEVLSFLPLQGKNSSKIICINTLTPNFIRDSSLIQTLLDQEFNVIFAPTPLCASIYLNHYESFRTCQSPDVFQININGELILYDSSKDKRHFIRDRLVSETDKASLHISTIDFSVV